MLIELCYPNQRQWGKLLGADSCFGWSWYSNSFRVTEKLNSLRSQALETLEVWKQFPDEGIRRVLAGLRS
jgi:hypothetical protein